ncbi:GNAT family N-acetyltransferase [Nocardioides currus]|uniref:Ribosomal-protein-alanine acetyltransferase n=1 Tax=Nocardioides currus TaxID=2133958 RepID=A0A2R7YZG8_9ACTN|nr:GNAT family N-acetyltransferase [Nocardioides currus]PUA81742.1 ribosomal-protein-alanine acetyltransferase [Nocardioides currus]
MIRLATATDLPSVAALEAELFGPDAWDLAALRSELEGPGRRFVVDVGDDVRAYAVSRVAGDVVDLQRIGVAPAHRRAGVATGLLEELMAHPAGADRMMLEVSAANDSAIAFYLRHGFTRIGTRRRYYRDGSDATVLSVELPAQSSTPGPAASSPSQSCS